MTRILRVGAAALIGLLLLGGVTIVALQVALSRGALTTQIDHALERATGRRVTHGAIALRIGLRPRIALLDTTIANIPGGSQPDFARIGRLEVTLALLPLIAGRVEIESLALADAEITLERDAAGQANWVFGGSDGTSSSGLSIASVRIDTSHIRMSAGPVTEIGIDRLRLTRDAPGDPLELDGRISLDDDALTFTARLGRDADGALPLEAEISGEGLHGTVRGTWPRSADTPVWSLALHAEADSAALQRLARRFNRRIPPLGRTTVSARLGPGEPWPALSELTIDVGPTDLGSLLPGLRFARTTLRAEAFDAPVMLSAQGWRGTADLGLHMQLPPLSRLAGEGAIPVELAVTSGRSRLDLSGPMPRNLDLTEAVFEARLTTPDLALLSAAAGADLPRMTGVTAQARLGGLTTRALRFDGLTVTADALEASGDLVLVRAPRLSIEGRVSARRLDLDGLSGVVAGGRPRRGAVSPVIPDVALPVETLRRFDAALRVAVTHLRAGGTLWRDVSGTVALRSGRLTVDPLAVTSPGGPLVGRLQIDAATATPHASLRLDSQGRGLDLGGLRRAFGVPAGFQGTAELALDLRGAGATMRALAATLSGEAGVAMVGGRFTGGTALRIGPDLTRALLPRGAPAAGVALRCLALRLSAENGVARSETFLLAGDFGRIDGSLVVNLRNETIAARLLPDISLMGITVRAPVTIGGTLAEPRVGVDPGAALARVMGDTVANRLWRSSTAEFLRGTAGSTPPGGDCGPALTLARLGRVGPMPEAAPTPIPLVPREIQGAAQEVVRGIGGLLGGRGR